MKNKEFAGASKINTSFLKPLERRLDPIVLPRIPGWVETQHLTLLTVVWCLGILGFSYLASSDIRWLWAVSVMIVCQYLTDYFDGKLGKYRGTGLERWGYYMDHLLDYFFLASLIVGYAFILPEQSRFQLLLMLVLFGAYDMSTFLAFAAMEKLQISYLKFGPTEFRLALVVINGLLVQFGTRHMISGLKFVNVGALVGLLVLVYQTQKKIRRLDMERKENAGDLVEIQHKPREPAGNITVQTARTLYELGSR
ncbi:MAG: CDP-alcohol phosphatidyltransferase [Acidobacteria bacterium]|nr:CDP-alcohol phosphatidyltransferase [Acidobacteriota bacterium]